MDIHSCRAVKQGILIAAALIAILLASPQVHAQQQLTLTYSKAALSSLSAIQSDTSVAQDKDSESIQFNTIRTINAAQERAASEPEQSLTTMIRQLYRLRLRDNELMRAYGKLMEIDDAPEPSDEDATQRRKNYAVAQFADAQAAIERREEACFGQLEQSLTQRSPQELPACSEWIQKAKLSEADTPR